VESHLAEYRTKGRHRWLAEQETYAPTFVTTDAVVVQSCHVVVVRQPCV